MLKGNFIRLPVNSDHRYSIFLDVVEDVQGHHDMNRLTIVGLITRWSQDCCPRNTSFLHFSRCKDLLGSLGCGKEDAHYRWYTSEKRDCKDTAMTELGLGFRVGSTRGTVKAELFRQMVYPSSTCQDWTAITWNMICIHYGQSIKPCRICKKNYVAGLQLWARGLQSSLKLWM
jgi:hypothetical protein